MNRPLRKRQAIPANRIDAPVEFQQVSIHVTGIEARLVARAADAAVDDRDARVAQLAIFGQKILRKDLQLVLVDRR